MLWVAMMLVAMPVSAQGLNTDAFDRAMEELRQPRYREVTVYVTAYSQGDQCDTGDTMANGEKVHEGAVAYNGVPFGTKVIIDGREYTVKDRVGRDDTVDIYMNSVSRSLQWGRQRMTVRVEE